MRKIEDLDMARNMLGPLDERIRARVERVLENPTQETWDDAYSIIVGSDGWMTLWQAVLKMDRAFPRSKPCDEPWPRVPSRETLLRALAYATH
jgi:hypothetical protein